MMDPDEWMLVPIKAAAAATLFNKLEYLESITETGTRTFLNNSCLGKLSLPALRDLQLYMVGTPRVIVMIHICLCLTRKTIFFPHFQDQATPTIMQSTLNKLGKNCPKLLRVFATPKSTTPKERRIFARRLNKDSKFRKVHLLRKEFDDGNRLRFDYDSVDSCCSDVDCGEHKGS
jgi:hypothetical protein